ncbi:hypothetical protein L3Q82_004556 [Scortum barcoo]|uniref:Uncharacterized protein n=1 Tax=Scortum barcoo TaxID=214431 RepID=A0ACB8VHQ5_9TELE|nr:hypothetical protein L3Q82_004556 [Scortum barcoo]
MSPLSCPGNASVVPPGRAGGSVWGEGSLGISAQTAASATQSQIKRDEDGWMDGPTVDLESDCLRLWTGVFYTDNAEFKQVPLIQLSFVWVFGSALAEPPVSTFGVVQYSIPMAAEISQSGGVCLIGGHVAPWPVETTGLRTGSLRLELENQRSSCASQPVASTPAIHLPARFPPSFLLSLPPEPLGICSKPGKSLEASEVLGVPLLSLHTPFCDCSCYFFLSLCGVANRMGSERVKLIGAVGVKIPEGSIADVQDSYKYHGIQQANGKHDEAARKSAKTKYLQRVKQVLKSQLNGRHKVRAITAEKH